MIRISGSSVSEEYSFMASRELVSIFRARYSVCNFRVSFVEWFIQTKQYDFTCSKLELL